MRNLKITVQYDGTKYCGWQKQPNSPGIQGEIEYAIYEITKEKVNITGSGRTDAGVHALGQVANFKTNSNIPASRIPDALNAKLPKDISIIDCEEVDEDFHSRYSAKGKIYRYLIYNKPYRSPLYKDTSYHIRYDLDIDKMRSEAKSLIGEHDFKGFMSSGSSVKDTVRTIYDISITEKEDLQRAFKNEEAIKVLVKEEVKGGLVAYYGSIRVFIPASLASRERIELNTLLGKEIEVKLTELDLRNRKVVASRRVLEEEAYQAKKKELWKTVKSGEKREGTVKKIIKVGAIVDIGGITGLIHINDFAWERVKKVEDIVNVGDKVTVFVGDVDPEHERVSLILKDVDKEPWKVHADNIKTGDVIEGKVVKFMSFGAFVELFPGVEGLVHINEITDENIAKPSDVLEIGQMVKVKVLDVNKEDKRISLSIKDAVERSNEYLQYNDNDDDVTLGDLFKGLFN